MTTLESDTSKKLQGATADLQRMAKSIKDATVQWKELGVSVPHLETHERSVAEALRKLAIEPAIQISIVGMFRAGKSTLLNALIGHEFCAEDVLETTSTITRLRYGSTFEAKIAFVSGEEVLEATKMILGLFSFSVDDDESPPTISDVPEAAKFLLGGLGLLDPMTKQLTKKTWESLAAYIRRSGALPKLVDDELVGTTKIINANSAEELASVIRTYTAFPSAQQSANGPSNRCYLVSEVSVCGPFDTLAPPTDSALEVHLLDTPGLGSTTAVARQRTTKHLEEADCVVFCIANQGNLSATDIDVVRTLYARPGGLRRLIMTITRIDQIINDPSRLNTADRLIQTNKALLEAAIDASGLESALVASFVRYCAVSALANLDRSLNRRQSDERARNYSNEDVDGFSSLRSGIRGCLDENERLISIAKYASDMATASRRRIHDIICERERRATADQEALEKELGAFRSEMNGLARALDDMRREASLRQRESRAESLATKASFDKQVTESANRLRQGFDKYATRISQLNAASIRAIVRGVSPTASGRRADMLADFVWVVFHGPILPIAQNILRDARLSAEEQTLKALEDAFKVVCDMLDEAGLASGDAGRATREAAQAGLESVRVEITRELDQVQKESYAAFETAMLQVAEGIFAEWIAQSKAVKGKGFVRTCSEKFAASSGKNQSLVEGLRPVGDALDALLARGDAAVVKAFDVAGEVLKCAVDDQVNELESAIAIRNSKGTALAEAETRIISELRQCLA
jgi:GTPase Era involved in 16S rRNA processing